MGNKITLKMLTLLFIFSFAANAKDIKLDNANKLASEQIAGTLVSFEQSKAASNFTLSVTGPNGFNAKVFSKSNIPSLYLEDHGQLKDGVYNYQISAAANDTELNQNKLDNGRGDNARRYVAKSVVQSGHFRIVNGEVFNASSLNENDQDVKIVEGGKNDEK